jgi:hypothetical protein
VIYQLSIFTDYPGRVGAHIERYREHTCRLLEKHGMKVVGCWTCVDAEQCDQVVSLTAHESADGLRAAQAAFNADPEVQAMVAQSERDGPIIRHRERWILQPVDFSPLK